MKEKLLLLHGALGSQHQFDELVAELEEMYDVYRFDFEGHGGLALPSRFSIDLFAGNVLNYLRGHGLESVHIFGYSMGGYVALKAALKAPEKVAGIVTLGTKFDWSETSAQREVKMLDPEKIAEKVPHFADRLRRVHDPVDWREVVRHTADMMIDLSRGGALEEEEIRRISCPVVICRGTADNMVTEEESRRAARTLGQGKLVVLPGVKHPIERVEVGTLVNYIRSGILKEDID